MIEPQYNTLREKQKAIREEFSDALGLRIHRALSWLGRAEGAVAENDLDGAFIFYWIAFNAAYAGELPEESDVSLSERQFLREYFSLLLKADANREIYGAIWQKFSGPIRILLENPFVFAPFWKSQRLGDNKNWQVSFDSAANKARSAIERGDAQIVLEIVFDRLYVLRNQLVHGGATCRSSVNREQVSDGVEILGWLIPEFLDLMMENPEQDWGQPYYPVVKA
jgi:hypothetical protein